MLSQQTLTALAAVVSLAHSAIALPQPATPYPDSVLYTWRSTDPQCTNTAVQADCASAFNQICANANLATDYEVTVGQCKAIYMYDEGNTVPTAATCTAASAQILAAGIGGAVGYNDAGNRTIDPLYVIYPITANSNGNCFKKTGDTTPVLANNMMPNGQPMETCPLSSSKPKRSIPSLLSVRQTPSDNPDDREGVKECLIEDVVWGSSCTTICLLEVAATSWAGPFAIAGGLACLGGCEALAWKVYRNCMTNKGENPDIFDKRDGTSTLKPNPSFVAGGASANVCLNIKDQLSFDCPAMEKTFLTYNQCEVPPTLGGSSSQTGGINF